MSIITDLNQARRRFGHVEGVFYVIPADQRIAYTQEIVDELAHLPMVDCTTNEPRPAPTYAEVEAAILEGSLKIMGTTITYQLEAKPPKLDESARKAILALQAVVDANTRYAQLTGRRQEAIALHPDHARELLAMLTDKCVDTPSA